MSKNCYAILLLLKVLMKLLMSKNCYAILLLLKVLMNLSEMKTTMWVQNPDQRYVCLEPVGK